MNDRILVVEDDPDVRLGLALRFRTFGYDTDTATDAGSAVAAATCRRPDLVLLDIELGPLGDGFDVLEGLRADPVLRSVPVIILTGRDLTGVLRRAEGTGVAAVFEKPVDFLELRAAIHRHLGGRPARLGSELAGLTDSSLWLG